MKKDLDLILTEYDLKIAVKVAEDMKQIFLECFIGSKFSSITADFEKYILLKTEKGFYNIFNLDDNFKSYIVEVA
jgi:hypothetical protein